MAEYINVEKPFLEKLKQLGWQVIDQGIGIPQKPEKSLRKSFREVALEDEFKKTVRVINKTSAGQEWLTDDQLDAVFDEITAHHGKKLFEANKNIFHFLTKNTRVRENTVTGEQDPVVRLIDYDNWENNSFVAINQFRIKTPGGSREGIIPDIVLFVNGLPFIVVECKDTDVSEPLSEAEIQIRRYSNRRDDDFGQHQPTHHQCKCAAGEHCAGRVSGFHGLGIPGRGGSGRLMLDWPNYTRPYNFQRQRYPLFSFLPVFTNC